MPIPSITALPPAPDRSTMTAAQFSAAADAWVTAITDVYTAELNAFAAALVAEAQSVIAGVASVNGNTGILTGITENTAVQTLTNKTLTAPTITTPAITDPTITGTIKEDVYTITDGASVDIDPGNGSVQLWTLGANRTPTATNFDEGESVTLHVADGTAYAITWTTIGVVWMGGTAPTLPTTGFGVIVLWKKNGVINGKYAGGVAS